MLLKKSDVGATACDVKKPYLDFNSAAQEKSILDVLELEYDNFIKIYSNDLTIVAQIWLRYKNAVHKCIQMYVTQKIKLNNQSPWLTREILQLKYRARRLARTCTQTANSILPSIRTELRAKIKLSKYPFYNVKMHNFLCNNARKVWIHLTHKNDHVKNTSAEQRRNYRPLLRCDSF